MWTVSNNLSRWIWMTCDKIEISKYRNIEMWNVARTAELSNGGTRRMTKKETGVRSDLTKLRAYERAKSRVKCNGQEKQRWRWSLNIVACSHESWHVKIVRAKETSLEETNDPSFRGSTPSRASLAAIEISFPLFSS